jgi:hypothetical protein
MRAKQELSKVATKTRQRVSWQAAIKRCSEKSGSCG